MIGTVTCVRWNSGGDMLASSSIDQTVNVIDLKTENSFYTGTTPDGGKSINS